MRFCREHAAPIEADFQRVYGIDLWREVGEGRLSLRRLGVLLAHLPAGSEVDAAIHGEHARWRRTDDLLAAAVTLLAGANWQRSGGKCNPPEPITRPESLQQVKVKEREKAGLLARLKDARARARAMASAVAPVGAGDGGPDDEEQSGADRTQERQEGEQ